MPPQPEGAAAGHLAITGRTRVRRKRERGTHDRSVVDGILDEGLVCHVGVDDTDGPVVTPMAYARVGDHLYLHGAPGNRTLRLLAEGAPACVTVTLIDGLVLARSAFHHSLNYRCVMLFGTGRPVDDEEKVVASRALLEHMAAGRSADARLPNDTELRSTLIVAFPVEEGSAKVRSGGPIDDDEDLASPIWAGVVPFALVAGAPVPDTGLPTGTATPAYVDPYPARGKSPAPEPRTASRSEH